MTKFKRGGFRQGGGNSGGRSKFGGKFGGRRGGNYGSGGRLEFFPVVCSECKKNCEVPFRPTGDKPVYCRECFDKQKHVPGRNSNGMDHSGGDFRPQREYRNGDAESQGDAAIEELNQHLATLESKVNRILELVSQRAENSVSKIFTPQKISKVVKTAKAKKKVAKK